MMFDLGGGIFFTGKQGYAGVAVAHLTKPEMTVGLTGRFFFTPHLYCTGGYTVPIGLRWDLQPSVFMKTDFRSLQYSVNVNVVYHKMYWGDRKSTRLNSSHRSLSRMPSSA